MFFANTKNADYKMFSLEHWQTGASSGLKWVGMGTWWLPLGFMGKGARKLPLLSKEACERYVLEKIAEKESQWRDVFSGPGDGGGVYGGVKDMLCGHCRSI